MRLGASFSHRRARGRGLHPGDAFRRLLEVGLSPLRLSAYWDELDGAGWGDLDWQLAQAGRVGREVLLTVGMKAQGWPEFAIPDRLVPALPRGADVGAAPAIREAVLRQVQTTIERYRGLPAIVAWQVENEPLNRSGPRRWWIGPDLLREELEAARRADPGRPVVLNVFARFNLWLDLASRRAEAEALALLRPGDVLGLDVYRSIGFRRLGRPLVTSSRRWRENAARWRAAAAAEGKRAWVVEAQAEPWAPAGYTPDDMVETVRALRACGYETVMLWGAEHWLAEEAAGDDSWLGAVRSLLAA